MITVTMVTWGPWSVCTAHSCVIRMGWRGLTHKKKKWTFRYEMVIPRDEMQLAS